MDKHSVLRTAGIGLIVLSILAGLWIPAGESASAAVSANDEYYGNQYFLRQIKADKAWSTVNGNTNMIVAVLDSGVDTDHPDLQGNLLPGINLVSPGKKPEDDNGHGTQVTGILAAKGNNSIGVAGVMWNARVLPIKVLDQYGEATMDRLVAGIHQAIDHKAKVILLSVTNLYHSKNLEQAIKRAESNGVVVVAAAGNEASRVDYPAAYPTVIAVGAVDSQNKTIYQSNRGPELNLVAPGWGVYTTMKGGRYGSMKGTSAAAPQVAAAAALILARNPGLSPLEVRQILYGTAVDLGAKGWDRQTGYGLLDVNRAVRSGVPADISEPNNSKAAAAAFPIESQMRGQLNNSDKVDWFYIDVPYNGNLTFTVSVSTNWSSPIAATFYQHQPATYYVGNGDTLTVPANAGRLYVKLERGNGMGAFTYVITSKFAIHADRYEGNNDKKHARPLPPGNHISVTGNFHTPGDVDWFSYYVRDRGKLNVTVTADTYRMDPVLYVARENTNPAVIDNTTGTNTTEKADLEVFPGKYYVRVYDYRGNAVNGEYRIDLRYTPERRDTNEPNDTYQQATRLGGSMLMTGTLPVTSDFDWFALKVTSDSYVTIRAPYIPVASGVRFALFKAGSKNQLLASVTNVAQLSRKGTPLYAGKLSAGTYYVRLNSTTPFRFDTYRLTASVEKLVDGYRDISSHWARKEIARLTRLGVVKGFEDATFRPNRSVTRAEFASMLIRTLEVDGRYSGSLSVKNPFRDITRSHWAYNSVMRAYSLGIIKGYPNGQIRPNQPVSRAEMAVMIVRAKHLYLYKRSKSSFRDVPISHWASPAIESLVSRGYVKGFENGQFRPQANTTRAEVVIMLAKAFEL